VAVADLQSPREARALDIAGTTERDGGVSRLTRCREKDFRIDALTYASGTPGKILVTILYGS
jgi:hypothetical protein